MPSVSSWCGRTRQPWPNGCHEPSGASATTDQPGGTGWSIDSAAVTVHTLYTSVPPGRTRRADAASRCRCSSANSSIEVAASRHLAALERLLTAYADVAQPYYPRAMMEKEEDAGDYDHLSRFDEWGEAAEGEG